MTTLEKTQQDLLEIRNKLMRGDIQECCKEIHRSKALLSLYLKGKGKHTDTALSIIQFLRKKINQREIQFTDGRD